ncbi:MAG: Wzz/FepE/Etk N-terminal domain-containing protein, partial [Pseudomonadota bacterium]
MTESPQQSPADVDLLGLITIAFSNKLLITVCALVFFGLATAFAFYLKPVYRTEVVLLPADEEAQSDSLSALAGQFGGLASLAGINISGDNSKEKAMATLSSRSFTLSFIREKNLMPILFANKWDNEAQKWKPEDPVEHPTEWDAFKLFDRKVRFVEEEPRSGTTLLAIQWKDRELAATWANELAARVNKQLREQ